MKNIENSTFIKLIGIWKTSGNVKSNEGDLTLSGVDSYELILNGNYILHKAAVKMGTTPSETFEIIKLDKSVDTAIMHYYNSEGENGQMRSSIISNEFTIEGEELKFKGTFNTDSTEMTGKWYIKSDNDEWADFIDLKLEKQG